ncbi:hypothetical protein AMA2_51 [Achromobacter phage AMA2]|nr:hypothetical protein AMA2_51 [Achromobacter phage AMA2]
MSHLHLVTLQLVTFAFRYMLVSHTASAETGLPYSASCRGHSGGGGGGGGGKGKKKGRGFPLPLCHSWPS